MIPKGAEYLLEKLIFTLLIKTQDNDRNDIIIKLYELAYVSSRIKCCAYCFFKINDWIYTTLI